ncbi:MAG: hypothetical protein M1831_003343 [Alyxoria varia]|nr:MAG: hypothetical protein M1831_003343 [Alyxoria varia]
MGIGFGVGVGGALLLSLVGAVLLILRRRRNQHTEQKKVENDETRAGAADRKGKPELDGNGKTRPWTKPELEGSTRATELDGSTNEVLKGTAARAELDATNPTERPAELDCMTTPPHENTNIDQKPTEQ